MKNIGFTIGKFAPLHKGHQYLIEKALEEMDEGQVLAVKMNDGEPVQNVPRSIKEEGHQILKLDTNDDGTYTLFVKKVGE